MTHLKAHRFNRRQILGTGVAAAGAAWLPGAVQAQAPAWPAKNIRIVPTAPMFAQAILNIWSGTSVSSLFETETLVPIYEGMYQRG